MSQAKTRTVFFCTDCGNETPKWAGRCAVCGSWNTLVEQPAPARAKSSGVSTSPRTSRAYTAIEPLALQQLEPADEMRFETGLKEFDRVLGGGAVVGSLVLVGGAPGIGKSTLLLQICGLFHSSLKALYVSGEESVRQIKMRAERLRIKEDGVFVLAETEITQVISAAEELKPDVMIIDSIQTLYNPQMSSSPGSVGQVKDCTMSLLRLSKDYGITIFLVGHVNKEGAIAGPKVLEHIVDCVLYFEGERSMNFRVLRAAKNRFGSTNEIGVFEMLDTGLSQVANPSEMLLSGRPQDTPGTCVTCIIEGTRPILAEVQALVAPSSANMPRRNSNGVEYNRAMMLLAVIQQRGGLRIGGFDAYINVIGGLNIDDPGVDLAVILALASAYVDKPVRDDIAAFGEVGLTGELRQVAQINQRLSEIARMGFKACILPNSAKGRISAPTELELIHASTISQAIKAGVV